ncbi:thymidine kinase [Liquorilactobacillus hordei]|uniref:Thymidine kinase n=1 Tax=Liquorilactobacillus hordei DSM 19519 TaxID=1423759 RepID=A0A0R1MJ33_9LACO|nr:thymidine kinase [Liquorilactobacillus hordei]KRL07967.1 thymidine kinase [Liquorilactobacillus hordei DSM 19519]QYH51089.1 thymidine kinase [Liquorilactobacillus hordei DSM 19519]
MAQLFFRYGTMNSGKSVELLKVAHNYRESGKIVILFTSSLDTRSGKGKISSRIGISDSAIDLSPTSSVCDEINNNPDHISNVSCILVDESQFLTEKQVEELVSVVDILNIPVICYGLKNDFMNNLFEGSEALLKYADKIEEIKTVCKFCNRKATMNLRMVDGRPARKGEQLQIGDSEYYSVCREHWYSPNMKKL